MIKTDVIDLPYKPITEVANRPVIREHTTRGRETNFVDFKKLKIRDGFNLRKEYKEIEELAASIEAIGLQDPMVVDMLKDGTCYVEQGHRRYRALKLLKLNSMELPGIKHGTVECFVNPKEVDELTRLKRQYTSNSGDKYTPLELGELCNRLARYFGLTQEQIGEQLGMSRQNVKNMMIIADQPDSIKQAIQSKNISVTAAVDLTRKITDADTRNDIVQEAVKSGKAIGVSDVKRIIGDKKEEEFEKEPKNANISIADKSERSHFPKFDEGREEITLCQNVIKNIDKIGSLASHLPEQLKNDMERYIDFIQADMEQIRLYIHKNKKQ